MSWNHSPLFTDISRNDGVTSNRRGDEERFFALLQCTQNTKQHRARQGFMTRQEEKQARKQICKGRVGFRRLFPMAALPWLEPAVVLGPTLFQDKVLGEEAPELVGVQRPEV